MKKLIVFLLVMLPGMLPAALTEAQRLQDFQTMVALYARQYAPFVWKQQAFGVDIFENAVWVARIRAAKSDLEYHEICHEWVAQLRDGHARRSLNSSFLADLGVYVDIYDGKVLIESIVRARYPVAQYPFEVGDELVSLDGKPVEEWITEFSKYRSMANPVTTRRNSADAITFRTQSTYPRAALVGPTATVEIRRASGALESYELRWQTSGVSVQSEIGPLPTMTSDVSDNTPNPRRLLEALRTKKAADSEPLLSQVRNEETGELELRRKLLGWGSRFPRFGFPAELRFQLRRGNAATDQFYSGVFNQDNLRIGYLRIPGFTSNVGPALQQMDADLAFLNANTDGLVLDLTRNTGGGCIALEYASRLMDKPFTFGGEHLLATQANIRNFELNLRFAQLLREPQWVIDTYAFYLKALQDAAASYRALSAASPACDVPDVYEPLPTAYKKPIVFLVDEFTVSFGDYFMAVMQDNNRGLVVGQRTAGWGGSVTGTAYGPLSEANAFLTITLDRRARPVATPDLPTAPFIENIGVVPEVPLEMMTRENLLTNGRTYVLEVARLAAQHIRGRLPSAPSN
jgi:hypothetical protein